MAPRATSTFSQVNARQFLAIAIAITVGFAIGPSLFFSVCVAALLWLTASSPAERVLAVALPAAFRLALAFGAFHFEPPTQIVDLATDGTSPVSLFLQQDLWWARYLVEYPSIMAMDLWGMRFVEAFALYSAALLPVTSVALLACIRVWRRLSESEALMVGAAFGVLVAVVASQMNGRLIPAHLGMTLILLAQARVLAQSALRAREALLMLSGLVLGHMTSGTGLVAYADLIAGGLLPIAVGASRAQVGGVLWILSAFFGPLLLRDLLKNVDFYGGGAGAIVTMLDHGAGIVLRQYPWLALLAFGVLALVAVTAWTQRSRFDRVPRTLWPAIVAMPVTSIGGLYGYSTLSMGLPPLLILLMAGVISRSMRQPAA